MLLVTEAIRYGTSTVRGSGGGGSRESGIELPAGTTPCSFSLLASLTSPNKAVLLIADSSSDPTYICFQLQVVPVLTATVDVDTKTITVKAAVASSGPLNFDWSDVFLASASFDFEFDINAAVQQHDDELSTSDTVAVIGIVTTSSVLTVVATETSLAEETTVLSGCVAKLYLCDVVGDTFVWMIELCDRSIWCWVTPDDSSGRAYALYASEGFTRPANICEDDYSYEFGTITRLGDASMWMLGSDGTTSEFTVGCVPSSNHGCLIKVAQEGTRHHRTIDGDARHALNHEIFTIGKGTMTPPTFAMSLLHNLLSTDTTPESERHFERYLRQTEEGDAVSFALRLLVVRSVEMVSQMKRNKAGRRIATDAFNRVIALLAQCLSPGNFASLLLSIARQIEPSCMSILFPLPENVQGLRTIEDLYIESIRIGSLATPATSLPLLPKKTTSLDEAKEILYHCLLDLACSFQEGDDAEFDASQEQRQFVRDLLRFSNQLEQMDEAEFFSNEKMISVDAISSRLAKRNGKMLSTSPIRTPTKKKVKSRSTFSILSPVICSGRRRREERAVYEAASTFIGSGFEELEYDPSEAERFARVSVMFLTGKMLVRLALKEKHGWKRAADMSRLVLGDTVIEESGAGVVAWMQRMQLATLAVTAHKISGAAGYLDVTDSDEMADTVSDYLAQGMFAANHELLRSDANWLLELIILSLSRLSPTQPVNQGLAPGLVLMATIVGHVAGRMEEMMKGLMKRECAIITCYNEAKQTLSNI